MSIERANADYALRWQGSFDGISFSVLTAEMRGSTAVSRELRVEVGQRAVGIAPVVGPYTLTGYLTGPNARRSEQALRAAFATAATVSKTLVHPWLGELQVLVTEYAFNWQAEEIEFVRFTATFELAEFPLELPDADVAKTPAALIARLVEISGSFVNEPVPLLQLQEAAPDLLLTSGDDVAFVQAATSQALSTQAGSGRDVPLAIQQTGAAIRQAENGELSRAGLDAVSIALLTASTRTNSATLWAFRQELRLFAGPLGFGALATVTPGQGQSLQAIAVAENVEPGILAQRNRALAATWFARQPIKR